MAALGNSTYVTSKEDFISDEALEITNTCLLVILGSAVALFGIVFNVFNILVFLKQGLNDTVNIGLMGLAVADLCSLATLQVVCLVRNPLLFNIVDIAVDEFQHLTAAAPHNCFTRVSSWITAYIMLERCLCVVVPLKIKSIITPRVTISVIVSIFVFVLLTLVPEYASCYIDWRPDTGRNRSVLGLVFLEGREEMATLGFNFGAGTQLGSFAAVILFTAILVTKVQQKSKWRNSTNRQDSTKNDTSNRDQKMIKMIILVAVIYCVCFLPLLCLFLATSFVTEFIIFGAYSNSFVALGSFAFLLDSVNSTVNISVYYRMSTKYRTTFDSLILKKK